MVKSEALAEYPKSPNAQQYEILNFAASGSFTLVKAATFEAIGWA
jgi:hypothetical protein